MDSVVSQNATLALNMRRLSRNDTRKPITLAARSPVLHRTP